ncbi:MAG: response regulator transcription factor [Deltaproteobacteria bacterium]|nr:response regulator transcription factor [Deltaproteobacteria bacterium]
MTGSTRILIVEDDPAFRQRFASIVASHPSFTLVAAVGSCAEGISELRRQPADVLLCDLGLPDGDGADVVREARRLHPGLDALVVTIFGDEAHVMRSLEAGATGYLLKDSLPEDFIATIRLLRAGGSPIHPTIARRVLQQFSRGSREPLGPSIDPSVALSGREQEVLNLVSKGYRGPEIANLLGISHHTVASHIKNIYKKLEVSSRGEAVYEASRLRLL